MATTKNNNLFYNLYSTKNDVTSSGYKCGNSIDEEYTSFDISGSEAQITDSNGEILSSMSLGNIHVDELSQYNIETKVLQPHSTYLLQGSELGEAHKTLCFIIPENISQIEKYYNYCDAAFDISYTLNNQLFDIKVLTKDIRETSGNFIILIQKLIDKLKLPISVSIKFAEKSFTLDKTIDYIEFIATEEGFEYTVRNVILYPILPGDNTSDGTIGEFYDSPFTPEEITSDLILSIMEEIQPKRNNGNNTSEYSIQCNLYKELLQFTDIMTDDFNTFIYELDIVKKYFLSCFDKEYEYGKLLFPKQFEELCEHYKEISYKFFNDVFMQYNIFDLIEIFDKFVEYIYSVRSNNGPNNCYEDLNRRVEGIKYKNGAMKGCVILPEWPDSETVEHNVLLAHHVSDQIEICVPVDLQEIIDHFGGNVRACRTTRLYEKALAHVQINALIPDERTKYIEDTNNMLLTDIMSNKGFVSSFDTLQLPGMDTHDKVLNDFHRVPLAQRRNSNDDIIDYHNPEMYIDRSNVDDEGIWENNPNKNNIRSVDTHQAYTEKYIGLYKYMEYLSQNDLWLRIGDSYMITGKKDDPDNPQIKNLLSSLIIYNPNDVPIRIKCMIFS